MLLWKTWEHSDFSPSARASPVTSGGITITETEFCAIQDYAVASSSSSISDPIFNPVSFPICAS